VFIILPFLVICKISIISSIGAMECLLSLRCYAHLEFPFPHLKVLEMFLESYTTRFACLSNIFSVAVMTC